MNKEDILKIVNKLKSLSSETANQPVIARRGVLPNLVTFIKNKDIEVQTKSAETLKLLSSHPENQKLLSQEPGLVDAFLALFNDEYTHKDVRAIVSDILVNIGEYLSDDQKDRTLSLKSVLESLKSSNKEDNNKKRNITINIPKMNEQTKMAIQKVVTTMKGIISYSMSLNSKELFVYAKTTSKYIVALLEGSGYPGTVISEEVCSTELLENQENVKPVSLNFKNTAAGLDYQPSSKAVVCDTLQDRIAKRKQRQQDDSSQGGGFFTRITSVFW
jgi:hypothetical protein